MDTSSAEQQEIDIMEEPPKPTTLPFPPLKRSHIMHCSYHYWHPKYRSITPKARLIALPDAFVRYLRADGILLPPEDGAVPRNEWSDSDSGIFSSMDNASEADDEDEEEDPSAEWRETHLAIQDTITELGGKVVPKLNWSAPKDGTWINPTNSMECRSPNDIYLLLKSSDFVTHDLDHAFDDCDSDEDDPSVPKSTTDIPYHLVLRKHVVINPSVEFRCFVRRRKLIAICQRDLNHFEFLFKMEDQLRDSIQKFFDEKLKDTFPDESFAFDVYIPPPHAKVWLIDINPWAQRTDPLLFSWMELLTMPEPVGPPKLEDFVRLSIRDSQEARGGSRDPAINGEAGEESGSDTDESDVEELYFPEFRLIRRDDPEAYGFNTPQYSAHKLPKDVIDASRGGTLQEIRDQWKEMLARQQEAERKAEDSDTE